MGLEAGDKIVVEIEGVSREFTFAGSFRDAVCGTELMGFKRFILNGEDFDEYTSDETVKDMYGGKFLYIHTADLDKTLSQIADISDDFTFSGDAEMLGQAYIFDMIIMGLILAVRPAFFVSPILCRQAAVRTALDGLCMVGIVGVLVAGAFLQVLHKLGGAMLRNEVRQLMEQEAAGE